LIVEQTAYGISGVLVLFYFCTCFDEEAAEVRQSHDKAMCSFQYESEPGLIVGDTHQSDFVGGEMKLMISAWMYGIAGVH